MSKEKKAFKLSDQAIATFAMTLIKSLAEQCDIREVMKEFELLEDDGFLMVRNPPTVKFEDEEALEPDA